MRSQDRLNQFFDETDAVRQQLRQFSNEMVAKHGHYAFVSGFFEALLGDALMQLPKKKRAEILSRLA